jgi:FK506-binding protein 4/5
MLGGTRKRICLSITVVYLIRRMFPFTVHLVGKHSDRVFEDRDVSFRLGDGSEAGVVEGVEKALEKTCKGGVSRVTIAPAYAFGSSEHKEFGLPANATVTYTITLKDFEKVKESWEMSADEKLAHAEERKNHGTELFKVD